MACEIRVIKDMEELKSLREVWDDILEENQNDNPFIEFEWVMKWWEYFNEGHSMMVLVLMDEGAKGFCPLMVKRRMAYKEVNFIGYPQANYMDLIVTSKYREEFVGIVMEQLLNLRGRYIVNLHGFCDSSINLKQIEEFLKKRKLNYLKADVISPFISLENNSFENFYKERSRHKSIRLIQKAEKKLSQGNQLTWLRSGNKYIDRFFEVHRKRWDKKNDTSSFSRGMGREFFKELALESNSALKVYINTLLLNGNPIAFAYSIECRGRYLVYQIGHAEDFDIYGPGKINFKESIREAFRDNMRAFDFSIGYERYKLEWTDEASFVHKIIFPGKKIISKLALIKFIIKEKTIHRLKSSDKIVRFKRNTLGRIKYIISGKNFMDNLRTAKEASPEVGFTDVIWAGIKGLFRKIYFSSEYTIYSLDVIGACKLNKSKNYNLRELGIRDDEKLCRLMKASRKNIIESLYKGKRCFEVFNGEESICCVWIDPNNLELEEINSKRPMEKSSVFLEKIIFKEGQQESYTEADVIGGISGWFKKNNLSNVYIAINKKDKLQRNRFEKLELRPQECIGVKKILCKYKYDVRRL